MSKNEVDSKNVIVPVVGMGATYCGWSDRSAWTVIEVSKSKKAVVLQEDISTRIDNNGMSECQDYTHEPDPNGSTVAVHLRKDGRWRTKGTSLKGSYYVLGRRSKYHDFSF